MTSTHTPYSLDKQPGGTFHLNHGILWIACLTDCTKEDAADVLSKLNAHDALVEALEAAQTMLNYLHDIQLGDGLRGCGSEAIRIVHAHDMLKISAALALAKGAP